MSDQPDKFEKALIAAPAPIEWDVEKMNPDDVQRWVSRYAIWFNDIRCAVLGEKAVYNLYYRKERLLEEAKEIGGLPLLPKKEEEADSAPKPPPKFGVQIGEIIPTKTSAPK